MADELDLLRRANPVPVDGPHFGDGPLDHHAERQLNRLMQQRTPRRRLRPAWALAATAVVAAVVSALLFTGQTTAPAVAAPRPLVVRADSAPVPLKSLAELAQSAATDGAPKLRKGTHVQTWSLAMSDDKPPVTLPEERIVRWRADGSHTELVAEDGDIVSRQTYPPSWSDAPPQSPPPRDAERLRAYLEEATYSESLSTPQLLDAVGVLLDTWTLGARESAALVRLLARTEGLRPVGQVTDRLGRPGQAYAYDGPGARRMLILDPATGTVLGLETTFTKDQPEYGVKAGDVMEYSAWTR
ncbi:CU044_5270 family protein [Streptomyces sp. P17]|uniref:CU044_5270 family protein n=1 Tax=Streptomyces sp. P17 TaxID=3074716 RepID=UPI0028F41C32|nr:CU044_5270 family protein [Streptomyces sp. P17]MDT9700998.1 CU044_5270 family protein [Streptomyces sp. P17]